jgi:hypothetical protein
VTTSGSLALAQNQGGVLRFTSASAAIFFQFATPASGDIEGVTAGTGISGGGTSGTVTITNSMATEIDAKGDLIVGTGADAFARLAVGTNGHTLVADSSVSPTGLKWAAPAGGSMTSLATGSLTGATVTISTIDQTYKNLHLVLSGAFAASSGQSITMRFNGDTSSVYRQLQLRSTNSTQSVSTNTAWTFDDGATGNDPNAAGQLYVLDIYNYADTNTRCLYDASIYYKGSTPADILLKVLGVFLVTDNIDQITLGLNGGGNFGGGTYTLYGVK